MLVELKFEIFSVSVDTRRRIIGNNNQDINKEKTIAIIVDYIKTLMREKSLNYFKFVVKHISQ